MQGFLCAAPQLVLQLALWMRGTLTGPLQLVMGQLAASSDLDLDTEMGAVTNMTVGGVTDS